jgi:FlaA1/EpsC-like NDP-sugar epimerase
MLWLISITTFVGLITVRYRERLLTSLAYRWLLFRGSSTSFAERILIVGAGRLGELTSWLIQRSAYSTLFGVIGFVDDDPKKRVDRIHGVKVLGSTKDIPALVEKYSIAIIIMAISNAEVEDKEHIKQICESTDAKLIIMPDLVQNVEDAFNGIQE